MNTGAEKNSEVFRKIMESDVLPMGPDPAIGKRLDYYFHLQHSRQKIHYNSFLAFFAWFFSGKALAIKFGIVAVSLVLFMKSPVIQDKSSVTGDTCVTKAAMDTNFVVRDSCFN